MKNQTVYALVFACAIIVAGCGNQTQNSNTVVDTVKKDTVVAQKMLEYPIPTPFEITNRLNEAGAGYIFSISNALENADKYETRKQKAMNLGVYGADLSYASTYNRIEETKKYVKVTQQLSDQLGIPSAMDAAAVARIEANISNKDSLYTIISNSFYVSFDYLNRNQQGITSFYILVGGWIEGIYLSSQLAATAKDKTKVIEGIASQKIVLDKIIALSLPYKDDAEVSPLLAELNKVKAIYDKSDGKTLVDADFKIFQKLIESIRTSTVK